jgi:hypothetical protein
MNRASPTTARTPTSEALSVQTAVKGAEMRRVWKKINKVKVGMIAAAS